MSKHWVAVFISKTKSRERTILYDVILIQSTYTFVVAWGHKLTAFELGHVVSPDLEIHRWIRASNGEKGFVEIGNVERGVVAKQGDVSVGAIKICRLSKNKNTELCR